MFVFGLIMNVDWQRGRFGQKGQEKNVKKGVKTSRNLTEINQK
jgi:hypothetical protein